MVGCSTGGGVLTRLDLLGTIILYKISKSTITTASNIREKANILPFSVMYPGFFRSSLVTGKRNTGLLFIVNFTVNNHLYTGKIPTSVVNSLLDPGAIFLTSIKKSF